ncbi:MAG TPA: response regulator transcription factor [Acidobacteriaceae bacterium]|jgi:two-component system alkaline phosphatase synthesis response regulator PhoP|nr:response regulator transcription factor [Acidobacteriaceae bacterium]
MNEVILVVEDEQELCMALEDRLRSEGYRVELAHDGITGLDKATHSAFDLIILDIMLPLRSGLDVCADIRRRGLNTPILLLTARSQTIEKVVGLRMGADDYVTKPFDTHELMARVEVLLRRASVVGRAFPSEGRDICRCGNLVLDLQRGRVTRGDEPIELTTREFQLLRFMVDHRGSVLTRDQLLREVWGHEPGTVTRTVDVHIASLRQKLERAPKKPELIITVAGVGYKLQE